MKILFLLLFPLSVFAQTKPLIISGFDDVLRQSENTGLFQATRAFFKEDKSFSGMPELYQLSGEFLIVSAIPDWFENKVEKFLNHNHYPPHTTYLRNWPVEWSIEEFKIARIRNIIGERPNRQFIVIFDNSDPSIKLSHKLQTLFPQIISVYLRKVSNKKSLEGIRTFYTAFDIAYQEYLSGRMAWDEVEIIGSQVLKETDIEKLIPSYAVCPSDYRACKDKTICVSVGTYLRKICQDRQSIQKHKLEK